MITCGEDLTKLNEGCVLVAKPDAKGKWEIGWGHDVPPSPDLEWTQAQADAQFAVDYPLAASRAESDLGAACYAALSQQRQAVLNDVAYEIGARGLGEFKVMLAAFRVNDWYGAANALEDSSLFSEVPTRENRNVMILLTGNWP
jgi:GH24 family phage-related lysozyme (muramidase)